MAAHRLVRRHTGAGLAGRHLSRVGSQSRGEDGLAGSAILPFPITPLKPNTDRRETFAADSPEVWNAEQIVRPNRRFADKMALCLT